MIRNTSNSMSYVHVKRSIVASQIFKWEYVCKGIWLLQHAATCMFGFDTYRLQYWSFNFDNGIYKIVNIKQVCPEVKEL